MSQRRPSVSFDEMAELLDGDDHDLAAAAGGAPASISEGVAVAYERRQLCAQVLDELQAFSPKAAQIFVMREIEGEDTGAICRRLKVSSANCYVLLHRARHFLQQRFESFAAVAA